MSRESALKFGFWRCVEVLRCWSRLGTLGRFVWFFWWIFTDSTNPIKNTGRLVEDVCSLFPKHLEEANPNKLGFHGTLIFFLVKSSHMSLYDSWYEILFTTYPGFLPKNYFNILVSNLLGLWRFAYEVAPPKTNMEPKKRRFGSDNFPFQTGDFQVDNVSFRWWYCWWKKSCTTWDGAKTL